MECAGHGVAGGVVHGGRRLSRACVELSTTVLSSDVAAAICELKAMAGGELPAHGRGALFRWLLDDDLVERFSASSKAAVHRASVASG
jgi:hypothetical protein